MHCASRITQGTYRTYREYMYLFIQKPNESNFVPNPKKFLKKGVTNAIQHKTVADKAFVSFLQINKKLLRINMYVPFALLH